MARKSLQTRRAAAEKRNRGILRALQTNTNKRQIAKMFGVTVRTVYNVAYATGHMPRPDSAKGVGS